ncbi:lipid droplet-associated protein [Gordonia polyisoprenivorans]|uniref:lipid droplet-associated protein n=1 Tax=Gordonia polyisoprenivorans TaxID=84595 RepID=UPI001AD77E4C|nr:lipid droplet-associated protein [Gordonia polyisoprenivorans]QTI71108.1 lipid droplet-associated protein [Gordonia polyisoprenivorans]
MVRAPYPARIAAGLVVTAVEETRKLPTLLFTLPVTAVSETLQLAMRAQQGIAELAIKGDTALEMIFDRPSEEPAWARFDEDDTEVADTVVPIESGRATLADTPDDEHDAASDDHTEPAPSETSPAESPAPRADAGRFALYSSAPEEVITSSTTGPGSDTPAPTGPVPEVVEYTEYDNLTLAQLRAKLRSVGVGELSELLAYEKANRNRAPFITMIDNRITAAENKRSPSK